MKSKLVGLFSVAMLLSPLSLFAAQNSQKVTFTDAVTLNGTSIPAGTYRVEWDGTGNVTAKIEQGKKVVATAPATVVQSNTGYDGATETQGKELKGISFKNAELRFDQANTNAQGQ